MTRHIRWPAFKIFECQYRMCSDLYTTTRRPAFSRWWVRTKFFMSGASLWSPWPYRQRQHNLSGHQEPPTQDYGITSHKTAMFRKILFNHISNKERPILALQRAPGKRRAVWLLTRAAAAQHSTPQLPPLQVTDLTNLVHVPVLSHTAYSCTLKMEAAGSCKHGHSSTTLHGATS